MFCCFSHFLLGLLLCRHKIVVALMSHVADSKMKN